MTSVKKNILYNMAYQILLLILPLITTPYLSRVLGANGMGVYSYTYSVAYYFVIIPMLGLNNYGNREMAACKTRADASRTFCEIWSMQLALAIASVIVYVAMLPKTETPYIYWLWIPYVLTAATDINWLFFGLEEFKLTVTRNFVIKVITLLCMLVFVKGRYALEIYIGLMSVGMFVSTAALFPFLRGRIEWSRPTLKGIVGHLKPNIYLFIPVVAISLYSTLDKIMLGGMANIDELGYFENATKIANVPFGLIAAVGTVMLPRASSLLSEGKGDAVVDSMGPTMWVSMLMSLSIMFGVIAVSDIFSVVFFGPGYEKCGPVLAIVVTELPFCAWANVIRTQWLIPNCKDKEYILSVCLGAAVNIMSNLILIPRFEAVGAAIGLLAAQVVVCVSQTMAVRKELPIGKWFRDSVVSFGAALAMMVLVRSLHMPGFNDAWVLLIKIASGLLEFTLFALIGFVVTKNEQFELIIRQLIPRNPKKKS